jgi:hypothetical protein
MSRTIRRKGDKKHNHSGSSSFLKTYVTNYPDYWEGSGGIVTAWGGLPHLPMTGHEYYEKYYMFHRDTHPGFGWGYYKWLRKNSNKQARSRNKEELARFWKNFDYDIVNHEPRCLSWEV